MIRRALWSFLKAAVLASIAGVLALYATVVALGVFFSEAADGGTVVGAVLNASVLVIGVGAPLAFPIVAISGVVWFFLLRWLGRTGVWWFATLGLLEGALVVPPAWFWFWGTGTWEPGLVVSAAIGGLAAGATCGRLFSGLAVSPNSA